MSLHPVPMFLAIMLSIGIALPATAGAQERPRRDAPTHQGDDDRPARQEAAREARKRPDQQRQRNPAHARAPSRWSHAARLFRD